MDLHINVTTTWTIINGVGFVYDPICTYSKLMIQEYYSGPEYKDTLYLLTACNGFDFNITRPLTRSTIHDMFGRDFKRIIFVNFEQLIWEEYVDRLNQYLVDLQPDEIWEWQYENVIGHKYILQDRVKFMPLRYVSAYEKFRINKYQEQNSVCHFIGNITERRAKLFSKFSLNYLNFKTLCGTSIYSRIDEISKSGFSLNIHAAVDHLREQLRISENICLDIPVATEYDQHQYYPGLTVQFDYYWALNDPYDFFGWLAPQYDTYKMSDIATQYKLLTYTDEAYENYKQDIISTYNQGI